MAPCGGGKRGALLLCDLLRQHLPPEMGFEELLEARGEDGQLLRVKVFLVRDNRDHSQWRGPLKCRCLESPALWEPAEGR